MWVFAIWVTPYGFCSKGTADHPPAPGSNRRKPISLHPSQTQSSVARDDFCKEQPTPLLSLNSMRSNPRAVFLMVVWEAGLSGICYALCQLHSDHFGHGAANAFCLADPTARANAPIFPSVSRAARPVRDGSSSVCSHRATSSERTHSRTSRVVVSTGSDTAHPSIREAVEPKRGMRNTRHFREAPHSICSTDRRKAHATSRSLSFTSPTPLA